MISPNFTRLQCCLIFGLLILLVSLTLQDGQDDIPPKGGSLLSTFFSRKQTTEKEKLTLDYLNPQNLLRKLFSTWKKEQIGSVNNNINLVTSKIKPENGERMSIYHTWFQESSIFNPMSLFAKSGEAKKLEYGVRNPFRGSGASIGAVQGTIANSEKQKASGTMMNFLCNPSSVVNVLREQNRHDIKVTTESLGLYKWLVNPSEEGFFGFLFPKELPKPINDSHIRFVDVCINVTVWGVLCLIIGGILSQPQKCTMVFVRIVPVMWHYLGVTHIIKAILLTVHDYWFAQQITLAERCRQVIDKLNKKQDALAQELEQVQELSTNKPHSHLQVIELDEIVNDFKKASKDLKDLEKILREDNDLSPLDFVREMKQIKKAFKAIEKRLTEVYEKMISLEESIATDTSQQSLCAVDIQDNDSQTDTFECTLRSDCGPCKLTFIEEQKINSEDKSIQISPPLTPSSPPQVPVADGDKICQNKPNDIDKMRAPTSPSTNIESNAFDFAFVKKQLESKFLEISRLKFSRLSPAEMKKNNSPKVHTIELEKNTACFKNNTSKDLSLNQQNQQFEKNDEDVDQSSDLTLKQIQPIIKRAFKKPRPPNLGSVTKVYRRKAAKNRSVSKTSSVPVTLSLSSNIIGHHSTPALDYPTNDKCELPNPTLNTKPLLDTSELEIPLPAITKHSKVKSIIKNFEKNYSGKMNHELHKTKNEENFEKQIGKNNSNQEQIMNNSPIENSQICDKDLTDSNNNISVEINSMNIRNYTEMNSQGSDSLQQKLHEPATVDLENNVLKLKEQFEVKRTANKKRLKTKYNKHVADSELEATFKAIKKDSIKKKGKVDSENPPNKNQDHFSKKIHTGNSNVTPMTIGSTQGNKSVNTRNKLKESNEEAEATQKHVAGMQNIRLEISRGLPTLKKSQQNNVTGNSDINNKQSLLHLQQSQVENRTFHMKQEVEEDSEQDKNLQQPTFPKRGIIINSFQTALQVENRRKDKINSGENERFIEVLEISERIKTKSKTKEREKGDNIETRKEKERRNQIERNETRGKQKKRKHVTIIQDIQDGSVSDEDGKETENISCIPGSDNYEHGLHPETFHYVLRDDLNSSDTIKFNTLRDNVKCSKKQLLKHRTLVSSDIDFPYKENTRRFKPGTLRSKSDDRFTSSKRLNQPDMDQKFVVYKSKRFEVLDDGQPKVTYKPPILRRRSMNSLHPKSDENLVHGKHHNPSHETNLPKKDDSKVFKIRGHSLLLNDIVKSNVVEAYQCQDLSGDNKVNHLDKVMDSDSDSEMVLMPSKNQAEVRKSEINLSKNNIFINIGRTNMIIKKNSETDFAEPKPSKVQADPQSTGGKIEESNDSPVDVLCANVVVKKASKTKTNLDQRSECGNHLKPNADTFIDKSEALLSNKHTCLPLNINIMNNKQQEIEENASGSCKKSQEQLQENTRLHDNLNSHVDLSNNFMDDCPINSTMKTYNTPNINKRSPFSSSSIKPVPAHSHCDSNSHNFNDSELPTSDYNKEHLWFKVESLNNTFLQCYHQDKTEGQNNKLEYNIITSHSKNSKGADSNLQSKMKELIHSGKDMIASDTSDDNYQKMQTEKDYLYITGQHKFSQFEKENNNDIILCNSSPKLLNKSTNTFLHSFGDNDNQNSNIKRNTSSASPGKHVGSLFHDLNLNHRHESGVPSNHGINCNSKQLDSNFKDCYESEEDIAHNSNTYDNEIVQKTDIDLGDETSILDKKSTTSVTSDNSISSEISPTNQQFTNKDGMSMKGRKIHKNIERLHSFYLCEKPIETAKPTYAANQSRFSSSIQSKNKTEKLMPCYSNHGSFEPFLSSGRPSKLKKSKPQKHALKKEELIDINDETHTTARTWKNQIHSKSSADYVTIASETSGIEKPKDEGMSLYKYNYLMSVYEQEFKNNKKTLSKMKDDYEMEELFKENCDEQKDCNIIHQNSSEVSMSNEEEEELNSCPEKISKAVNNNNSLSNSPFPDRYHSHKCNNKSNSDRFREQVNLNSFLKITPNSPISVEELCSPPQCRSDLANRISEHKYNYYKAVLNRDVKNCDKWF